MGLPSPAPDRTAVVTGASSGIGAEIARQLARRGHGVTLVARRGDRLEGLAGELAATGVRAEVLPADLSDRAARAGLLGRVEAAGLVPYVLVNNAGLSTVGPVAASDPDAELNLVEVDVAAVADLCSRFLPGMVARGSGAVLNVASTAAFQPMPGQAAYAAAKAFVLSYTRSLGGELRGTGVTATALCPGPVETGFGEVAGLSDEEQHTLPKLMWETAEAVAKAGVDGLARGRSVVIPGPANRVVAAMANATPKRVLVPIVARAHPGLRDGRSGQDTP
jgi:short-subunit dehydrogenase